MLDISKATETLQADFNAADNLVDELYHKYFAHYFKRTADLEVAFRNTDVPITDDQLEQIITAIPLDIYLVSGNLAQFKQHFEIVKLTNKQRKKAKLDEDIDTEYQLMAIIYNSVINRVENEIAGTKELIMGAKKVWDARKRAETSVPINEQVPHTELPDYL